jgi:HAD superfamily hydrolase (TIGR01509 family)
VAAVKQERTLRVAARLCYPRIENLVMLADLKRRGFKLAVATNSIRATAVALLSYSGILEFFDVIVSNEDVSSPKPDPEIYLLASTMLGLETQDCLVIEDNHYGVTAAVSAGCPVEILDDPNNLDLEFVLRGISRHWAIG